MWAAVLTAAHGLRNKLASKAHRSRYGAGDAEHRRPERVRGVR